MMEIPGVTTNARVRNGLNYGFIKMIVGGKEDSTHVCQIRIFRDETGTSRYQLMPFANENRVNIIRAGKGVDCEIWVKDLDGNDILLNTISVGKDWVSRGDFVNFEG